MAAFTVRIGLEIGDGDASQRLASDAVRSHMRILRGAIGSLVITTYPSEPILAIAAARSLNSSPADYKKAIGTLLDRLVLRGLVVDRGMQGELCCRLLLTLARDKAVSSFMQQDVHSPEGPKVQAVELSLFLQALLGEDLGVPRDKILRAEFLNSVQGIWINFTHFVQLTQPLDEMTPSFLREAWSSGIAFQCAFLQPVIDGFFVGYDGDLHKQFDISKLVIISWQSKVKSQAAAATLVDALTSPPIVEESNSKSIGGSQMLLSYSWI